MAGERTGNGSRWHLCVVGGDGECCRSSEDRRGLGGGGRTRFSGCRRQLWPGLRGPRAQARALGVTAAEGHAGLGPAGAEQVPGASWHWAQSRAPARGDSCPVSCPLSRSPAPASRPPWTSQDAYSEIAYLFAEFFRDLDIVPSDIIAGLVLLRQRQRAKRNAVLDEVSTRHPPGLSPLPCCCCARSPGSPRSPPDATSPPGSGLSDFPLLGQPPETSNHEALMSDAQCFGPPHLLPFHPPPQTLIPAGISRHPLQSMLPSAWAEMSPGAGVGSGV